MYIICKLTREKSRAKPSQRPVVHIELEKAEAELNRLAALHPGVPFGLFQMVRTQVKDAKTAKPEAEPNITQAGV